MVHFRILETWRLTAALLVMVWHFLRYAPPGHEPAAEILYRLLPLMEMFLMISGFLITMRYVDTLLTERGGIARFLLRRVTRLYPLYLATLAFFCLVGSGAHLGLGQSNWPGRYDLADLPANVLLVQAWGFTDHLTYNYVAWTLSAEWFCYLAFPAIVFVASRFGMVGVGLATVAVILLLEAATANGVMPFESWLLADTWGAYRALADFLIGALLALAVRASAGVRLGHIWPWAAMTAAVAAMLAGQNSYLVLSLLAFAIYAAAVAESSDPSGSAWLSPLGPVGRVSFGIYLIHPVVETLTFSIGWKMIVAPAGVIDFYVFWLAPMIVTVLMALASDRWFETPVAAWLNRRLAGQASRREARPQPVA